MKLKLFPLTNRFGRRGTIDRALALFHERGGRVIVEIGSIRRANPRARLWDGHSTVAWAMHAEKVYSVDVDTFASDLTRRLTEEFGNVEVVNGDGLEFLQLFCGQIDLLYLDAWDTHLPNCRSKHLDAYRVARSLLHDRSLILIDDARVKGAFVVPEAVRDGFSVVFNEYQVLLAKCF
jgi:predicted O-methyltransferase YrrM